MLSRDNITLTRSTYAAFALSNSACQGIASAWMGAFFESVGDKEPNRPEIHLDAHFTVKSIYAEYICSVDRIMAIEAPTRLRSYLSISMFNDIWTLVYPHVKLRMFKQVLLLFKPFLLLLPSSVVSRVLAMFVGQQQVYNLRRALRIALHLHDGVPACASHETARISQVNVQW